MSCVRFLYSLGFVLEQNRITCITLKVLSPWDSNIVDFKTELRMIFASCTSTRQVQCIYRYDCDMIAMFLFVLWFLHGRSQINLS